MRFFMARWASTDLLSSFAAGVGHPPKPLPDMRRARARSAQIGGPNVISQRFQVSTYSGEPFTAILARNLLSSQSWRPPVLDEPEELGPEMPLVLDPLSLPGDGEWLAGAGSGPDRPVLGPSRKLEGEIPSCDPGEEVTSSVES
jgi:hypothetical protein